jgi:hypothetical protein
MELALRTRPTAHPLARTTTAFVAIAFAAACGDCNREEERPEIPESVLGEGEFAAHRPGDGTGQEAPARPRIVHEEPPTPEDFAVAPVEGDWTTWRGNPGRSGLREVRPIRAPKIRWSVQVGIQGYANTPIVTGDAVYVASQGDRHQRADERDGLYRLNPETGAIVWHFPTGEDANGVSLIGGTLIVGTDDRKIHGVDPETGRQRWVIEQDCQIYHAPVEHDGWAMLIRENEKGYVAIDPRTGAVDDTLDCVRSERGALTAGGGRVYRAGMRELSAFDAEGKAWRDEPVVDTYHARTRWAPPLLTSSMLVEAVHAWPFGTVGALAMRPAAIARWADNGQVAWVLDVNDPDHATREREVRDTAFLRSLPWIANDRIFWTPTNAPTLVAWDATTGERLESVNFPDCRNRNFGSIVGTPSVGYLARHDGVLYAFDTAPLRLLWQRSIGLHGAAGGTETHFPVQGPCAAEPKDGTALFATPAIGPDGTLYVGSGDGWIYAFVDESW